MPLQRDSQTAVALEESAKIEQDLLATLMLPGAFAAHRDTIKDSYFCDELHREIFVEMTKLSDLNAPLRPKTLLLALGHRASPEAKIYITTLAGHAADKANLPFLVNQLRYGWAMRQTEAIFSEALEYMASGKVIDPSQLILRVFDELDPMLRLDESDSTRSYSAAELGELAWKRIMHAQTSKPEDRPGIRTGIAALDEILRPMAAGHLIVCLGRPGQGKSALACTLALNCARSGIGVMIDSLEMSGEDLADRMISSIAAGWERTKFRADIPYSTIDSGDLETNQLEAIENAIAFYATLPIHIETKPGLTVAQIAARARLAHAKAKAAGQKKFILIIDYLGLVKPGEDYRGSKVHEIGEITMSLKVLAKELGIPILLLCQMNRGVEQREDKRPTLADARDSGSIEQDADVVLAVYRDFFYLKQRRDLNPDEMQRLRDSEWQMSIGILKQRKGTTGWVNVDCDMATNTIKD